MQRYPVPVLRGLVCCDECGTTYVGSAAGGTQARRYRYYSCSRRKKHSDPRTKTLRELVEDAFGTAGGSGAVALGLLAGAFTFYVGDLAIDCF